MIFNSMSEDQEKSSFFSKNIVLVVGLLVLVLLGAGLYFLKPQYEMIKQIHRKIENEEARLAERQKTLEDMRRLLQNYEGVKEELYDLSLALPPERAIPNLLVQLEALANENGVLMEDVSYEEKIIEEEKTPKKATAEPAQPLGLGTLTDSEEEEEVLTKQQPGYATLEVNMSLSGKFDNFMQYIEDVQKNFRFLDIATLDFDLASTKKTSGSTGEAEEKVPFDKRFFDFSVGLDTYYLK